MRSSGRGNVLGSNAARRRRGRRALARTAILLATALAVQLLVPVAAASPAEAPAAFVDLKRQVLAGEEPDRDPVERLRSEALDGQPRPAVESAWRAAQNASPEEAPRAVLEAEAALLALAGDEVRAALEAGDATAVHAWLQVALARADAANRTLAPAASLGPDALDEEAATEALHAAVAVRAREAAWEAFLWNETGEPARAERTAEGAGSLAELLVPNASRRLPDGVRAAFEANATRVPHAVLGPTFGDGRYLFPGLAAGLTALQYDHDVEELEVQGQRAIDGAAVATRAAGEDPERFQALAGAAYERYGADRARLGLMGEGTNAALDEAYLDFRDAARNGSHAGAREAAEAIREAAGGLALLGNGVVLTVESGGVRQDRTHTYKVSLVRPPLDGVGRYEAAFTYDGDVLDVADVTPRADGANLSWEGGGTTGALTVNATQAPPVREASHLLALHLDAAGQPGEQTTIVPERVQAYEPDGDRVGTLLVRHGNVTLAQIEAPEDPGDANGSAQGAPAANPTPGAGFAGALLAGLLVAGARRRSP